RTAGSDPMLAILTTHAIQYQVPLWQALAARREPIEVWYLSDRGHKPTLDPGFGRRFAWDLDLTDGYPSRVLATVPAVADIGRFRGARLASAPALFRDRRVDALLINGWFPQAYW